ncbi:hypothetical protein ACSSZE_03090 [Acidithiobacillus caldus]
MSRAEHRRVLLRLYEDSLVDQQISGWLDGYSGRGLQERIKAALLIGLPKLLTENVENWAIPSLKVQQPKAEPVPEPENVPMPEPKNVPMPEPVLEPAQSQPEPEMEALPGFLPSSADHQAVAKHALTKIFAESEEGE